MTAVPGREIFGNVPPELEVALYLALGISASIAASKMLARVARWRHGQPEPRLLPPRERLRALAQRAVAQRAIASGDTGAGRMHRLLSWGFAGLLLATTLTAIEHDLGLSFLHGGFYLVFAFAADLAGLAFVSGLALAIHRRYVSRPTRLSLHRNGDLAALVLLAIVGATGFPLEGARIALDGWPSFERVSFVGWTSALALTPFVPETGWASVHRWLWGVHAASVAGFIASLPFTRLLHLVTAPMSIALGARRIGELRAHPGTDAPEGTLGTFTWKQLLELDACTSCGRCSEVCPATASGKPLSPMLMVDRLRTASSTADRMLLPSVVTPDELWSCTTCTACEDVCPVAIHHVDRIVDIRRVLVERGDLEASARRALESMLDKGNAWDQPPDNRTLWLEPLGVRILAKGERCETLYWVGCAGAYDDEARRVTEAVTKLLKRAGVDFACLGSREGCTGDMARRIGDEGLFQELSRRNVALLREHGVRRVITHCPHCLNTLTREYDGLDEIEIVHHSVLLDQLVREGRLTPSREFARRITLHDPCYLGRYNDEYDAPRSVLNQLPRTEVVEMPRHRNRSFCCGGGGGQMIVDVRIGERVPTLRVAEAATTTADVVATACPFCKIMLKSAAAEHDGETRIDVKDISEILASTCE
jgi:Fe-S oxidoreductase/nitrate reductase gamma subunit